MDFEAQRKKRMEDLAIKRKRLEEMRKQRAEKSSAPDVNTEVAPPPPPTIEVTPPPDTTSVDDLVNSLLSSDNDPSPTTTETTTESSASNVTPVAPTPVLSRLEQTRLRAAEWTTCQNVCSFTVLPVVPEVYEKGIQTEASTEDQSEDSDADGKTSVQEAHAYHRSPQRPRQRSRGDSTVEEDTPVKPTTATPPPAAASLTTEDISTIVGSSSFHSFLTGSAHIVERALGIANSIDLLRDLTDQTTTDASSSTGGGSSDVLHRARVYDSLSIVSRPVMDLQVSPHHTELFASSHGSVPSATPDSSTSGGAVCLWSILLPTTPEFIFSAASPVLMVRFHPENVHLLIGACYSGQIVLWDTRLNTSRRPTQRSGSSGKCHKHPVYSMCLARRGNNSGPSTTSSRGNDWVLITASTDGLLCHWDLDNLAEPLSSTIISSSVIVPSIGGLSSGGADKLTLPSSQSSEDLTSKGSGGSDSSFSLDRPISVSGMVLGPEEDERKLIIGSECGALFCFTLPFKPNTPYSKTGAHFGMITSLSVNPSTLSSCKHLLLTASVDWTIKLWHLQSLSAAATSSATVQPLLTFFTSSFQYVTSVQWSPVHPGVFAATASGGTLMLWNMCQSVVEPVGQTQLQGQTPTTRSDSGGNALNKAVWLEDGRKVLVGDSSGTTHCVAIRSSTATSLRSGDEERLELALSVQSHKLASVSSTKKSPTGGDNDTVLGDGGSMEEKHPSS
mmetsp:Transcript_13315/g.21810  ORF Transcript_13315/g.21810 Transcript_13315/m.21810 type:complete len:730 (+) Transcript_13315:72-2261(+)|eukprot:CAMPEP_0114418862 /NCGR_PEP_ID=MMETSP0103-20121206/3723_1 /TAXON_ID=37642 ORGANISM="Paraphysomonas imperforata, Strain PA2" /NCGR_SAMPLE_ID=MMETSP0103 /ASSEMBLY_ACC=CAM_ASM_000201 /LENGTH=729 /DNA_ID=CAMNT_0001587249 /DNA_START=91 /DNA_END=2280 /DNA_ORIENTATION=-